MNAEIVARVEESFQKETNAATIAAEAAGGVYASFGGMDTFTVMRLLANAISVLENTNQERWLNDAATFRQAKQACATILDVFRPAASGRSGGLFALGLQATEADHLGVDVATQVVNSWLARIRLVDALQERSASNRQAGSAEEQ